jgi:hypothetical protein
MALRIPATVLMSLAIAAPIVGGRHRPTCPRIKQAQALPSPVPRLDGTWELELDMPSGKSRHLTLKLRATDSAQRTGISPIDSKPHYNPTYAYLGVLSGNRDSTEQSLAPAESWDPDRPGVKVSFGLPGKRNLISIGSEQNDRTKIVFDGWSFWLEIMQVSDQRMSGTWTEGVWVVQQVDSGWWCARRRP